MLSKFSYKRARTLSEAVEAVRQPGACLLAGGTDLLGCLRDGVLSATTVVSLSGLKELKGISARPGGGMRIGAMTTLSEIAESKQVREAYPVLAEAAASAASPQLRNQGTIGGNLCQRPRCWYFRGDFQCLRKGGEQCFAVMGASEHHCIFGGDSCFIVHPSDTAPALAALDARLTISGPSGSRTVPVSSFFVLPRANARKENILVPGEIVTAVLLDAPKAGMRSKYRKVRERASFDFALVGAAVALTLAGGRVNFARVVLSGVAPAPWRVPETEKALMGNPLDAETVGSASAAAVKEATALPKNEYKIAMTRGVLEETLLSLA